MKPGQLMLVMRTLWRPAWAADAHDAHVGGAVAMLPGQLMLMMCTLGRPLLRSLHGQLMLMMRTLEGLLL